ncbi:MAG: DMT family transporter [Rhodospirillales bacterium]|nr:DMT family transporter [Rhodospirillales bacterium]
MSPFEWGLLVALSLLWGGSFFFTGVAVKELPTFTIVVCRVSFAALTLWVVMKFIGQKMPTSRRVWGAFFVMGFINNVIPFSLIVWGQSHIASGVASILNATTPLFTVIVAHFLTSDEKMTGARLIGVFVGLVGVAFMIGVDALQLLGVNILAQIAILIASMSYAFAGVFGRRFQGLGISPMAAATGQVTASSLMLVPIMLAVDAPWTLPVPSLATIGALVGIATLSTALAYVLYFRILAAAGATNLLLVTFLIPVSAILLGVIVLGEVLEPKHFIGMALIGGGLAAIDGRPIRAFRALFT